MPIPAPAYTPHLWHCCHCCPESCPVSVACPWRVTGCTIPIGLWPWDDSDLWPIGSEMQGSLVYNKCPVPYLGLWFETNQGFGVVSDWPKRWPGSSDSDIVSSASSWVCGMKNAPFGSRPPFRWKMYRQTMQKICFVPCTVHIEYAMQLGDVYLCTYLCNKVKPQLTFCFH